MAPELINDEKKYSCSIDVWSFGVFAYELAMVLPPWHEEKRDPVVLDNILNKDAPAIDSKWSEDYRDFVK